MKKQLTGVDQAIGVQKKYQKTAKSWIMRFHKLPQDSEPLETHQMQTWGGGRFEFLAASRPHPKIKKKISS